VPTKGKIFKRTILTLSSIGKLPRGPNSCANWTLPTWDNNPLSAAEKKNLFTAHNLDAVSSRPTFKSRVRIDGYGVSDGLEHRQICVRI